MGKHKTLKEIHEFLIKNNMLHREQHYDIEDQKLLCDFIGESGNEISSSLSNKPEIISLKGEIY